MTLSNAKGGGREGKATHEHITVGGMFSNFVIQLQADTVWIIDILV